MIAHRYCWPENLLRNAVAVFEIVEVLGIALVSVAVGEVTETLEYKEGTFSRLPGLLLPIASKASIAS